MFFLAVEKWSETASPAESGVFPWDPVALLTCDLRQKGLVERWAWELGSGEVTRRPAAVFFVCGVPRFGPAYIHLSELPRSLSLTSFSDADVGTALPPASNLACYL